jgi:hypothetical protein
LEAIDVIGLGGSAIVSQVYGHTGREVMGSQADVYARTCARCGDRDAMLKHPGAVDLTHEIAKAKRLSGNPIELFRGQSIKCGEEKPPSVGRMGPLPLSMLSKATEGRYHRAGQRSLYMGSSEDGCRRELGAWYDIEQGGAPWVIKLRLPLDSLRIADFMDWPSNHFVTAVFCQAGLCQFAERAGPEDYVFSQVVSGLVSEQFDGMRIRGVRGAPGAHYSNVVLFKGLDDWPSWIGSETAHVLPAWAAIDLPHEHIAVAAYYIWEKENRVHGRDLVHWCLGGDELRRHVLGVNGRPNQPSPQIVEPRPKATAP